MNRYNVGVVIPFYNGDEYILRCIDSMIKSCDINLIDLSIYIIDNGKVKSQLVDQITKYKNVFYHKVKPQIGYGRACNIGAQHAINNDSDYLIFLNQDTHTYPFMVEEMINVIDNEENPSIVSPMIFEYDNDRLHHMYLGSFVINNKDFFTDSYRGKLKDSYELPNMGAACIMVTSETIKKFGLFDPIFHMYYEDTDFIRRIQDNEGKVLLATKANIAHMEAFEEDEKKSEPSLLNMFTSAVIHEIRYGKYPKRVFIDNFRILRRWKGKKFALKYLKMAAPILLNPTKYQTKKLSVLKEDINKYIKNDTL